ncbi:hypothetical protein Tco_1391644 [Tanacetum coccineum]
MKPLNMKLPSIVVGDLEKLGAELEGLWCKVEACGGVYGGGVAVAYLRDKGRRWINDRKSPPFTEISSRDLVEMPERCQRMIMNCKRVANHVGYRIGNEQMMKVVSSGWSFVSAILGQMTYSIASLTLDNAGSNVMQGAPFTQGMIPSISIGGSISLEGFLPSILLLVVIIVTVVVVIVILIVVVDDVSLILKLSFLIIGFLCRIMLYYLIH